MQVIVRPVHVRKELTEIIKFYRAHSRQFMPQPEIDSICAAAEQGLLYAAELDAPPQVRRIVALSGLFPIADGGEPGASLPILELAGMALDGPAVGGLGPHTLQDVLVWTRVCGLLIEGAGTKLCVVSSVVGANEKSVASMGRCGLLPADTPEWLKTNHRGWISGDHGPVVDVVVDPGAVTGIARSFREFLKEGSLSRNHATTGKREDYLLRFDLGWARRNQPTLKAVSKGEQVPWLGHIPERRMIRLSEDDDDVIYEGPPKC